MSLRVRVWVRGRVFAAKFTTNSGPPTLRGIYYGIPKCTPHSTLRCSDHWRAFSLLWSPSGECREYFWISKPAEGWADMRGVATFGGGCSAQANLYVTQFMYLQNMRCHYPDLGVYIKRDTVNSPTSQAGKVLQLEKKTLMELVL